MFCNVKKYIKSKKIHSIIILFKMLKQSKWVNKYNMQKYPEVLQFPITNKCNSKCIMCNVTSNLLKDEMTIKEFEKAINDPIFKNLKAIGINGGEPFLCNNLIPFVEIMVKKDSLKSINIISNGFMTDIILEKIKRIYCLCKLYNIFFHVSFSLDGYGDTHNRVRGIPNAFDKTIKTIDIVKNNMHLYCDNYDVGCTVVKENVYNLVELDNYVKKSGINIKYRLGIDNMRLHNHVQHKNFSVLDDIETRQAAKEFFFSLVLNSKNLLDQYKYWAIFSYLNGDMHRKLGCDWRDNGITMDGEGNIYYCAVESSCLGNIKNCSGEQLFFCKDNIKKKQYIMSEKCDKCIHDYCGKSYILDVFEFIKFKLNQRRRIKQYM